METELTSRLANRLKALRKAENYSLDDLAIRSGISRASLSRMENADVSPTTDMLAKLCAAYGLTLTHLLSMVEDNYVPLVKAKDQSLWQDPTAGFKRISISPPSKALKSELLKCEIEAGKKIHYDVPAIAGLEHHLYLTDGTLTVTVDNQAYALKPGDCLRYHSNWPTTFETSQAQSAQYILALI